MYNNLLKSGNVVKKEETRVIDSNSRIAERLQYLSEILQETPQDEFYDDFSAGLDAIQVEQLLGDTEEQGAFEEFGDGEFREAPQFDTQAFEQMRLDAQNEADGILSAAREEAERIIADANEQAASIWENAKAGGHDEGYAQGYDEGLQIAKEAEEKCSLRERELEEYYDKKIDELEPLFVDKITDIYQQIFMVDLSDRRELVHYLITNAMRNIEGGSTFLVHVSKEDYDYVNDHKADLSRGLPGTAILEIIEDMTLSQSQCFIEADSGIFDCGLGTELSLLRKELTLLSYRQDSSK